MYQPALLKQAGSAGGVKQGLPALLDAVVNWIRRVSEYVKSRELMEN